MSSPRHTPEEVASALLEGRPLETPNVVYVADNVKIDVGSVREIVKKNPTHPEALSLSRDTSTLPSATEIVIDKKRLEAILQNVQIRQRYKTIPMVGGGWITRIDTVFVDGPTSQTTEPPQSFNPSTSETIKDSAPEKSDTTPQTEKEPE